MKLSAQSSIEYIMMVATGIIIAALVILKLIGIKGLAIWGGSQMNSTEQAISKEFENFSETNE